MNLRGKWQDRVGLYEWAFEHLFPLCKRGGGLRGTWLGTTRICGYGPVQQKIFTYSLSSKSNDPGDKILLLLAFGPAWLRGI